MKKSKSTRLSKSAKLSNLTQIPIDMALCYPYIRMCFNREIIVEDAGKLVHYDENTVKVMQRKNRVCIHGSSLKLSFLSNGDIRVTGYVKGVSLE